MSLVRLTTQSFIGGDLGDVGSAGVRYVNLYFWNNQQTNLDATPKYNTDVGETGTITVNVPSGTHKVTVTRTWEVSWLMVALVIRLFYTQILTTTIQTTG